MLFSERSLMAMLHGLVFSGGALVLLVTALFALRAMAFPEGAIVPNRQARAFSGLLLALAVLLWAAVLGGTFLVFPLYRATPPTGLTDLAAFPRAFLMANPDTRWLHGFGMEIKEHVPWIAAMLATAAAVVGQRHRETLLASAPLRRITGTLLTVAVLLVAGVALLGVFVNKVAPLW